MPKPTAPVAPPLRMHRLFEPARYSQHCLASAYLQIVPSLRRILASAGDTPAGARASRRITAS